MMKKLIIIGPSGSGKDYLVNKLNESGLKSAIKCTTRPMRVGEKSGITYNYLTDNEFKESIEKDEFITYESFEITSKFDKKETWHYGIKYSEFESSEVLIMTPSEFKSLNESIRKKLFVVFLDINREIRKTRLEKRNDSNDSIDRRLSADDIDFNINIDYDLKVTNPKFSEKDILESWFSFTIKS